MSPLIINIDSVVHMSPMIIDMINNYNLDALAVSETKIVQDDRAAIKRECSHPILHTAHTATRHHTIHSRGCYVLYSSLTH